jgi:hypothetical protein
MVTNHKCQAKSTIRNVVLSGNDVVYWSREKQLKNEQIKQKGMANKSIKPCPSAKC